MQTMALTGAQVVAVLDIARASINGYLAKGLDLDGARNVTEYDLFVVMGINRHPDHTPAQTVEAQHKREAVRRIIAEIGA